MLKPIFWEQVMKKILFVGTAITVFILFFIIFYILKNGLAVVDMEFLLSSPKDFGRAGGIFPCIVGTIVLSLVAIIIATPLGVGTSIYLSEYTRESKLTSIIRFGTDCLAGIPSIIFGLFGFVLFVVYLGLGWSILSGGLTIAFMILPTIIRTSEEAIKSVPDYYREVSLSLGGTKWQTIVKVVLPSALPGIVTGIILGVARSIEETAIVIFTAGSVLRIPTSLFDSCRTMSVHFYILAREGISMENAYGTATILIITILLINAFAYWLMHRLMAKYS
ncbi:phosphate ABC transporter, permease protein PstA [Candidatus Desantisbacteria bacterium CG2_30_40_21]|uniref:Phosphate transport system permease protein PstA n=4 Tax=unclassified Candidatus Desantisiibacteriota TaxID=3106372 RepID=A0A2M7J8L4_9BACT|nr:MAG: phosphate ABC transporter, permease protein PstA [Candidatus Desantisbacteria bacterium CG2_30_40_21]PIP40091.1 MAG: phosphate ABC transporter, permease protein PstA [Candidatus Desantisbacteria bacterium CG23_combo_of_CG06-09_8_20_14_all_40_23]PIX15736.1 MAG: phosphate ABC transporter, permease protein PstA [Candidatus Desantisbacteria bacterium CG_4_8_14_3_um_filter_40_12]PJB29424.1 MAG: phosphate ABC transporter, permease protein PstA [Candidatus Desantisbacteria bacterium CG_4_9_14_3